MEVFASVVVDVVAVVGVLVDDGDDDHNDADHDDHDSIADGGSECGHLFPQYHRQTSKKDSLKLPLDPFLLSLWTYLIC